MTKQIAKVCLSCGEPLAGRADKKFCDDQCRNTYNNKLNSDDNNYMRKVNNILRKNRKILQHIFSDKEKPVTLTKAKLLTQSFNFEFYTNMFQNKEGKVYYYCYEYGYRMLENNEVMVVARKSREN